MVEITRVAGQILIRPELGRVHEDAHHHGIRALGGQPHQTEVPLVQKAHGRHQSDDRATPAPGQGPGLHFIRLLQNFHHLACINSI